MIGDFGFAIHLPDGESCSGRFGSRGYTAPEILAGENYNSKCDIFSFACIIFALVSAELPLFSDDMDEYYYKTCYEEVDFSSPVW